MSLGRGLPYITLSPSPPKTTAPDRAISPIPQPPVQRLPRRNSTERTYKSILPSTMARASISVLAVLVLLGLVFAPAQSQDVSNTTSTDPVAIDVDSNTTTTTCPLSADALEGVDFSGATTACSDIDDTNFCSSCLCSVATALVAGSPTFAALANGTTNTTDLNLNTLVEQCAGTLGPVLLSALSTDSLTALAACDLNAAALTCAGGNTTAAETEEMEDVMASQGPATPTPVPMPAAPRPSSGAEGVLVSALLAAPVMIAALWM